MLLLPARSRACIGGATRCAQLLRWINERLYELKHHARAHAEGKLTTAALRQVFGIQRRFRLMAKDEVRSKVLAEADYRWAEWVQDIVSWDFDSNQAVLEFLLAESGRQAELWAGKHFATASKRWRQWIKDKMQQGAAAVHSFVKRVQQQPLVLEMEEKLDASPQAFLDAEQAK